MTSTVAHPASGADFQGGVLPSAIVSFAAGESEKTISIYVHGDAAAEPEEGFILNVFDASGATAARAMGFIGDDDGWVV